MKELGKNYFDYKPIERESDRGFVDLNVEGGRLTIIEQACYNGKRVCYKVDISDIRSLSFTNQDITSIGVCFGLQSGDDFEIMQDRTFDADSIIKVYDFLTTICVGDLKVNTSYTKIFCMYNPEINFMEAAIIEEILVVKICNAASTNFWGKIPKNTIIGVTLKKDNNRKNIGISLSCKGDIKQQTIISHRLSIASDEIGKLYEFLVNII